MPHLIIDLEMSGSEVGYHDVIQIGAILASDNWVEFSRYESLVYPDNEESFNEYSEDIHGITMDDLQDAPMSYEVIEEFEAWVRKSLKRNETAPLHDVTICGQSIINDINFLKYAYENQNFEWSFSYRLVELMSITHLFYSIWDANNIKHPEKYSLQAVAEHFGFFRKEKNHNALEDAELTFLCFKEYFAQSKQLRYMK